MTSCDECIVVTFPDHVGVSITLLIVAVAICVTPVAGFRSQQSAS
jgi:hypothetical protein